jgi:hypothetical protein
VIAEEVEETAPSGLAAIEAYLERALEQVGPDRRYFHVAMMVGGANEEIKTSAIGLDAAVARLLERARREDGIRADVVAGDIHSLLLALPPGHVRLVLDGLRATSAVLDEPPMAIEDYERFMTERARSRERGELLDAPN